MEVFLPLLPSSTGLPERSDQHSTRPLACPEGHWVWPLADSQANLTEPEKPKPYSSVFPNIACAHSDKLCEVTRSTARNARFYTLQGSHLLMGFAKCIHFRPENRRLVNNYYAATEITIRDSNVWSATLLPGRTELESCPCPRATYLSTRSLSNSLGPGRRSTGSYSYYDKNMYLYVCEK